MKCLFCVRAELDLFFDIMMIKIQPLALRGEHYPRDV